MRQTFAPRRQAVLFLGAHFAEGALESIRLEQRVVAEAPVAARRRHDDAVDAALEFFQMSVGPGKTERSDEMRTPQLRRRCGALDQQCLNPVHSSGEILVRTGPPRGKNAPVAIES